MPKKYRKKPVTIEAMELRHDLQRPCIDWMTNNGTGAVASPTGIAIPTLEGVMQASFGDFIIRGVKGEFYACKPDIFAATYEEATA